MVQADGDALLGERVVIRVEGAVAARSAQRFFAMVLFAGLRVERVVARAAESQAALLAVDRGVVALLRARAPALTELRFARHLQLDAVVRELRVQVRVALGAQVLLALLAEVSGGGFSRAGGREAGLPAVADVNRVSRGAP